MKRKFFAILLSATSVVALSSCGSGASSSSSPEVIVSDAAEENDAAKSEEDFKASCQDVSYENLARNNDYVGKDVHLTVKLGETSDNGSDLIGGFARFLDDYGYETNEILVLLPYDPDGDRPLNEDIIEIWGTYKGMTSETDFIQMTASEPYVEAQYYSIIPFEESGYAVTDYVELNDTSLQIGDFEFSEDNEGYPAVDVGFTFTNNSDIPLGVYDVYTIGGYQNGTLVSEYSPSDSGDIANSRYQVTIDPGDSFTFDVLYRYSTATNDPLTIEVYTQESTAVIAKKVIEIQQ